MKSRKMLIFNLCLLLTCFLFFSSSAFAARSAYDDFEGGQYFDWMRWRANQFARSATSGFLFSFLDGAPDASGRLANQTVFTDSGSITSIQANVAVDNAWLSGPDSDAAVAEISGAFYHNNTLNQDILAAVYIGNQGSGGGSNPEAWWAIVGINENGGFSILDYGILVPYDDASPLSYGVTYQAVLSYDSVDNEFTFTVDGRSHIYSTLPTNDGVPSYGAAKGLSTVLLDFEGTGGGGAVFARFDDVVVNGSAYDDFSTLVLNPTKWNPLEFVRQVVDVSGSNKAQLNIRAMGSDRQAVLPLAYSTTPYLEAKVAVQSGSSLTDNAFGRARLGGYFYNESRGPGSGQDYNGREGDVWVQVALQVYKDAGVDKIKAVASADVSNVDESSWTTLFSQDLATGLSFDTEYTLSIDFSGTNLTVKCNTNSYTYPIGTSVYEPSAPARTLSSKMYAGPGEGGYLFATFDDVFVDLQSVSGIVADNNGTPMAGVEVMAWNDAAEMGNSAITGGDGHFILDGMPPGPIDFAAKPNVSTGMAMFVDRFYLPPGQSKDFGTINLQKGALVAGSISLAGGSGGEMEGVEFWYGGKFEMGWGEFDVNEEFAFRLPAGQYQMNVMDDSGFTMMPYLINITDVNDDLTYGSVTLTAYDGSSAHAITGTVTDSAAHNGSLVVMAFSDDVEITPDNIGGMDALGFAEIDPATGAYSLIVPPSVGSVNVVLAVESEDDYDSDMTTLVATQTVPSTPASDVDFTYDTEGYAIHGTVRDGGTNGPLFGASALLYQVVGPDEVFAGFVETNQNGQYILFNARAGTYKIAVTSRKYPAATVWTDSFEVTEDTGVQDILIGGGGYDELAVHFEGVGLYHYANGSWKKIHNGQPQSMLGFGSDLVADFGSGVGLYRYSVTGWQRLNGNSAVKMCAAGSTLYVDFGPGVGLYMNDGSWKKIHNGQPQQMLGVGTDLVADFGPGVGLYLYGGTGWQRLNLNDATAIVAAGNVLYVHFSGVGLYRYDGSWKKIHNGQPQQMLGVGTDLVADFGSGVGLYRYSGTGWQKMNGNDATDMCAVNLQ